ENQRTDLPLTLLFGHSHEALAAADLVLVASGTATLETALFKRPMVIAYRQSPITWALMRQMLYLPYVGMPNILAGERLVPELLQDQATPANLAGALLSLVRDTAAQRRQVERFREFHDLLRRRAAQALAVRPEEAWIDGNVCPQGLGCAAKAFVDGDATHRPISAASILAKTARDAEMIGLHERYPQYGFAGHKGYATPEHLQSLGRHGPCEIHRRSFYAVRI